MRLNDVASNLPNFSYQQKYRQIDVSIELLPVILDPRNRTVDVAALMYGLAHVLDFMEILRNRNIRLKKTAKVYIEDETLKHFLSGVRYRNKLCTNFLRSFLGRGCLIAKASTF
jgi:hypothetical protein